jgi:hypothetical protein
MRFKKSTLANQNLFLGSVYGAKNREILQYFFAGYQA